LTADKFITKGNYRPFIPENLRAINLAAFEMVDFVIIDNNPTPIKNLLFLKPNYFAKGFEYSNSGLPPATQEELQVVESYGGEMIFTPGDVVFSSTKMIESHEPNLEIVKLLDLMKRHKINFSLLKETVKKFKTKSIHVVGDVIIDTYTKTNLIGGNTKTPTPSVQFQEKIDYIGGGGIVAQHIKAAGANAEFTTIVGNDQFKKLIVKKFKSLQIKLNAITDRTRPTTNKNTINSNGYKLLKIDTLDNHPISDIILRKIINKIENNKKNAIIFSDFRHGIFNKQSILELCEAVDKKTFKVADSQVATRWGNITDFKNFDLITPNEKEVRFSLADQDANISELTRQLMQLTEYKNLILKVGDRGAFCVDRQDATKVNSFVIPSFSNQVVDAVGAGDALLAYSTLGMLVSNSLIISSIIGSIAAACECEVDGNIPISANDIIKKINAIESKTKYGHQQI